MNRILFTCLVLLIHSVSFAEKIEFSKDQLAAETVLPVFDRAEVVKNRNVVLAETFELGLFVGAQLSEAFFRQFSGGLTLSYHMNEVHGLNFIYTNWLEGETSYKQQLEADPDLDINLEGAPELEYLALMYYQFTAWYGKISMTKQTVSNLHLYLLLGGGIAGIGGEANPAFSLGLGQKLYFTDNFALRFDLRGVFYQGPDPLSVEIPVNGEVPATSEFEKTTFLNSIFSVGLVFLI